ncbi:hypothetical protein B6A42_27145 (plasmid) [Vibrio coralliilyticus]|nr:hypothetical protein B6A42_27145 [Vibrio coralliilyticus]
MALRKFCKFTLLLSVIFGALLLGQASQFLQTLKDHQRHEINEWIDNHPEQASTAKTFIKRCFETRMVNKANSSETPALKEPMSLYDCGYSVNADQLVHHLQNRDKSWLSLAWPLSIFE